MGVSGSYTVRGCTLGHMGLNAIGRGVLTIEDSTLHGNALIRFRSDYGSTWEGDLIIRNCRWIPACGDTLWPHLIHTSNDGTHDFGYACSMPRAITIDGVLVDDSNHPEDYQGLYLFTDPDEMPTEDTVTLTTERPFPYELCHTIRIRQLATISGKKPQVAPNLEFAKSIVVIEEA